MTARLSDADTEADFLVITYQPWLHWTKDYLKLTWLKLYIGLLFEWRKKDVKWTY